MILNFVSNIIIFAINIIIFERSFLTKIKHNYVWFKQFLKNFLSVEHIINIKKGIYKLLIGKHNVITLHYLSFFNLRGYSFFG